MFNELNACILDDQFNISENFTGYYIDNKELTCSAFEELNVRIQYGICGLKLDPRGSFLTLLPENYNPEYPFISNGLIVSSTIIELSFSIDNGKYIEYVLQSGVGHCSDVTSLNKMIIICFKNK